MILEVQTTHHQLAVALSDAADLRALSVTCHQMPMLELNEVLAATGLGYADETHAWLTITTLAALGRIAVGGAAADADWDADFAAMIGFARSQDWLSGDGLAVRAHCTSA